MSYETALARATKELRSAFTQLQAELHAYPTPISGCDAQYNHLISQRGAISHALQALDTLPFVATPRTPDQGAGVESR
ncbi:MAG: hypothetical protein AAFQ19_12570 [Pseudomonadota bacterium]